VARRPEEPLVRSAEEGDEAAEAPGAGVLALALEAQRQTQDAPLALHVGGHHRPAAPRARPRRLVRAHHPLLLRAAHHAHSSHHCHLSLSPSLAREEEEQEADRGCGWLGSVGVVV
jgi:hypothetical protein